MQRRKKKGKEKAKFNVLDLLLIKENVLVRTKSFNLRKKKQNKKFKIIGPLESLTWNCTN